MSLKNLLILFSKEPKHGQVKTRLIPHLGEQGAYELYVRLFQTTLNNALSYSEIDSKSIGSKSIDSKNADLQIWLAGKISPQYAYGLTQQHPVSVFTQLGPDLGGSMANAFCVSSCIKNEPVLATSSECLERLALTESPVAESELIENKIYDKVIIIGGDCVSVDADYLAAAFKRLDHCDCVLGPAQDGGFVLMGINTMSNNQKRLWQKALQNNDSPLIFRDIDWGESSVLNKLLENFEGLDLTVELLEEKWDVDEVEDLALLAKLPDFIMP